MYDWPSNCCGPMCGHYGWTPAMIGIVLVDPSTACLPAVPPDCSAVKRTMTVPHEIEASAANPSVTAMVGGRESTLVTVEYLAETGASSPATVKAVANFQGSETVWSESDPPAGFYVKEAALSVQPGSTLSLDVANITARLRWCETICC